MKPKTEPHIHKYEELVEQKVLLSAGSKTAQDTLKQRKCKCGKVETYDLERRVV